MISSTLSHFRIVAKLGEGGMGEVYRAEDTKLGRVVAIKVLPEAVAGDPERLARFEREAKVLASLNHPHIASIYAIESAVPSGRDDPHVAQPGPDGDGTAEPPAEARAGVDAHDPGERSPRTPAQPGDQAARPVHFLVMELAEGEDLEQRLDRGPLPLQEALGIALQITQALEEAHERGIIHRDLKPANVKVDDEGRVKVLDFGLAKALDPTEASSPDADLESSPLTLSPTLTQEMTGAGVILGTAAYMSPEQAKGKRVDRRADIWAFGVVLWEMLTGRRLFTGGSSSEVMAGVLMGDLDLGALPPATPLRVRRLVERCLRREASSRLRDIGDARLALEETLAGGGDSDLLAAGESTPRTFPGRRIAAAVLFGAVLGAGSASLLIDRSTGDDALPTHLSIPTPPGLRIQDSPEITPDGRTVVYRAFDVSPDAEDHRVRLWLQRLDGGDLVEIERSVGASSHAMSPDGRWLAFTAPASELSSRSELRKVPIDLSTPPVKIADFPSVGFRDLLWTRSNRIFTGGRSGDLLMSWGADGGAPAATLPIVSDIPVFRVRIASATSDGRHLLASVASFVSGVYRQDVGVINADTGELRVLVEDGSWSRILEDGRLLFSRRDAMMAAPIDVDSLELTGSPMAIMDGLWAAGPWTGGTFALSASGHLLYRAGGVQGVAKQLAILDRQGNLEPWSQDRLPFNTVSVSPDGRRLATQVDNIAEGDALLQIRVSDVESPRLVTVGSEPGRDCTDAAWSPDSQTLAYDCAGGDSTLLLVRNLAAGEPSRTIYRVEDPDRFELIGFAAGGERVLLQTWTGEGDRSLASVPTGAETVQDAEILEMEESAWTEGRVSPDGRWLAYISRQTGRRELFIRQVLDGIRVGPRHLVASDVDAVRALSNTPVEGAYELLASQQEKLVSVEIATRPSVRITQPVDTGLDPVALGIVSASALSEDRWMIVQAPDTENGAAGLRLVLNWTTELRERLRR